QPANYDDGKDYVGTVGGTAKGSLTANPTTGLSDAIAQIALADGQTGINYNFSEQVHLNPPPPPPPPPPSGSISGQVFVDGNQDGVLDTTVGDFALAAVRVALLSSDGTVVGSTTTGLDGSYGFTGLAAGTYTVRETQPIGYDDGKDYVGSLGGSVSNDQVSQITL